MLTRPDPQTLRHGLQVLGDSVADGIGRSAADLAQAVSGLATSSIRRTRPPRPSMLVRALIVALFTALVVGTVAALWTRNERIATARRQDAERELDAEALDRAADEGMTSESGTDGAMVGIPIVNESSESEGVSTVA